MPRVLVDLLFLTGTKGGMETYARRLYSAMPADTGLEFVGLIAEEAEGMDLSWFPGEIVRSGIRGDDRVAWAWGELHSIPGWVRRTNADLVHSPANVGPPQAPVPVVLSVHDLLPFVHPEWVPGAHAPVVRWMVKRAAHNAARLLTISEASKTDLLERLKVPADRIDLIPLAGSPVAPPTGNAREESLILTVGNRMPHKNTEMLVRAIAAIPQSDRPTLAITGGGDRDPLPPLVEDLGITADVKFLGWVTDAELEGLYSRATMVAVPTRFEGFGLPVLEAMSRGCPVICSDIPVLHDVAGEAAVYVDADDPTAWATRISQLLSEPAELSRMSARGYERAAGFSWEKTARSTVEAFYRALRER
jgi:glycosyltransferase involved in cell wall biosynthesis